MKKVTKEVLVDASDRLLFTMSGEEFDLLLGGFHHQLLRFLQVN